MDLELATTRDMLDELRRRGVRFVYAGIQNRNLNQGEVYYACFGRSRHEVLQLIRALDLRVKAESDLGAAD